MYCSIIIYIYYYCILALNESKHYSIDWPFRQPAFSTVSYYIIIIIINVFITVLIYLHLYTYAVYAII